MTYLTRERHRPFGPSADRFIELLARFPRVQPVESEEMIALYLQLTILEVGLLASDESIAVRLDSFIRTHSSRLKRSWRDHLVFAATIAGTLVLLLGLVAMATG